MTIKIFDRTPEVVSEDGDVEPRWWGVGVYEVWRSYGGPEEGGWYFDSGELVESYIVSADEGEGTLDALCARLEQTYPRTGRYTSVIYDGGDYRIKVRAEEIPEPFFPKVRPHYE